MTNPAFEATVRDAFAAFNERRFADFSTYVTDDLVEHIGVHMQPAPPGEVDEFEFGLNLILEALERLRTAEG